MSKLVTLITGGDTSHLNFDALEVPVHVKAVPFFLKLKYDAMQAGFDLTLASGYRSFDRQLGIWNAKVAGEKTILDANGCALDIKKLNAIDVVHAILYWSALPGASRHHWGTDVDIYDASALPAGQTLQLTVEETQVGGVFESMYAWLDAYLLETNELIRPFMFVDGGIAREPWHISAAPISKEFTHIMTPKILHEKIRRTPNFALKSVVLKSFDTLYERYVYPYLNC